MLDLTLLSTVINVTLVTTIPPVINMLLKTYIYIFFKWQINQ